MVPQHIKRSKSPEQALSALMRLCARAEKCSGDALSLIHICHVSDAMRSDPAGQLRKVRNRQLFRAVREERMLRSAETVSYTHLSRAGVKKAAAFMPRLSVYLPVNRSYRPDAHLSLIHI